MPARGKIGSWCFPGETAINAYEKGAMVKAKVLDVDVEKERISLGIKQLQDDPAAESLNKFRKGEVVTCVVTAIQANGIEVKVPGKHPTARQIQTIREINQAGGVAFWATSLEEVKIHLRTNGWVLP